MSFRTTLSDIELCNRALDMVPAPTITALDGSSREAVTAARWYKPTVAALLERHHWNLATTRVLLTAVASDREQWAYAYQRPAICAFLSLLTDGVTWWPWWSQLRGTRAFERVGPVIYSNVAAAYADITSYDVTEADFDEEFADIIVLALAARLALPITKDQQAARALSAQAQGAMLAYMARDLNENPQTYGNTPTESELTRLGIVDGPWTPADPTVPGTDFDGYADPIGITIVPDNSPPGQYYYEG